jgi:very-short-patch-repair endonuclease
MLAPMEGVRNVSTDYATFRSGPPRDVALANLAERQHGVVTLGQLRSLGLTASGVRDRAVRGRLHRVHRGVYSVGHPLLTGRGRLMAAVLACGHDAVLSHRSAAGWWGLRPDSRRQVDVTLPRRTRGRTGIDVHATATLRPEDVTVHDGVPCTSVARTLLDLAEVVDRRGVERAVEQAEVLRLYDGNAMEEVLARAAGRRGAEILRRLAPAPGPGLTASELEERFLALCRTAALPQPEVNAWLALGDGTIKADFLWRAERLLVETDGHASHGTRGAFERDRRRDQQLVVAGFRVVRFTWRQVAAEPDLVSATVGALLGR